MRYLLPGLALWFVAMASGVGQAPASAQEYRLGARVLARWMPADPNWYPAIVTAQNANGVALKYDDGDAGVQPASNIREYDWKVGSRVYCRWQGGKLYYPGQITAMKPDRLHFDVLYNDGDRESTDSTFCSSP